MDEFIEGYLEKLVSECLKGAKLAILSPSQKQEMAENLRDHFYDVTTKTLIEQLSNQQLMEVKDLDPDSPEMTAKMSEFAAVIPGFYMVLDKKLKSEMDQILQTGQVPND